MSNNLIKELISIFLSTYQICLFIHINSMADYFQERTGVYNVIDKFYTYRQKIV